MQLCYKSLCFDNSLYINYNPLTSQQKHWRSNKSAGTAEHEFKPHSYGFKIKDLFLNSILEQQQQQQI